MSAPGEREKGLVSIAEKVLPKAVKKGVVIFLSRSWSCCSSPNELWAKNLLPFFYSNGWHGKHGDEHSLFCWDNSLRGRTFAVLTPTVYATLPLIYFILSVTLLSQFCWGKNKAKPSQRVWSPLCFCCSTFIWSNCSEYEAPGHAGTASSCFDGEDAVGGDVHVSAWQKWALWNSPWAAWCVLVTSRLLDLGKLFPSFGQLILNCSGKTHTF